MPVTTDRVGLLEDRFDPSSRRHGVCSVFFGLETGLLDSLCRRSTDDLHESIETIGWSPPLLRHDLRAIRCIPVLTGQHCSSEATSIIPAFTNTLRSVEMAVLNAFSASAFSYVAVALIVYLAAKILYRLKFHPLASFPGPKLAAMTNLYGAFFDLRSTDLPYVKMLPALHLKYGHFLFV